METGDLPEADRPDPARTWSEWKKRVAQLVARGQRHPRLTEKAVWRELTERSIPEGLQGPFDLKVEKRGGSYVPLAAIDPEAERRLVESFGKTAIITDLAAPALSDAQLVEGFVARSAIEEDWKWLKYRAGDQCETGRVCLRYWFRGTSSCA